MGLLDQILGGIAGVGRSPMGRPAGGGGMGGILMSLLPVVLGMLANRASGAGRLGSGSSGGGLGGLLEQFTQRGYGRQAQSWVSTGQNEAIDPDALRQVFGDDGIAQIAAQAGVSEDDARGGLAQLLPDVVDHFTPDGKLPPMDQLVASIDDYQRRLEQ